VKAVVGLGNPGDQYRGTRHNLGFDVVDAVASRWGVTLKGWKSIADVAVVTDRGALLVEPRTFMNLSGDAVGRLASYHDVDPRDVLVVVDDVNLPLGQLRFRRSGSAGGHNGLKSVIQHVGDQFPRLRIGVGRGDGRGDLADHVLATFTRAERPPVEAAVERAADAVEVFLTEGVETAMNRFNVPGDLG
jgi:PTH1 family peptidyl-tRNA hydrolase